MTGLMAKDPRHGRVRSQDGWREWRREGQSPAYSVRQERIRQSCEACLSLHKAHSQRNSSRARTAPNIHRHPPPCRPSTRVCTHRCTHVHTQTSRRAGAVIGGLGQTSKAFTAASDPVREHLVSVSLPEQPVPDSHSRPAGAGLHYHHPLHTQKAPAFQGLPWDHTVRQPAA